jgi:hypothetical protein
VKKKLQKILEKYTRKMMKAKRIYWKNRAKRWANLGDGNPKFFHTIATQSYKRILSLPLMLQMELRFLIINIRQPSSGISFK